MDNLNSYLYQELNNIPFDLYSLISNYLEINKDVKIAFVGGYVRDLLIKKFHENKLFNTIDLDLVIEGSSLSLARFIKQNIRNVDICLIKEFALYNTVELNINEIKVDIASAREEIYLSPGVNPSVIDSDLNNDLKRRDFTINAIAFEISAKKIYDPFDGINHIRQKKLHLLHRNSIRDDPSRLLRCSKYASRLGFFISKESLEQSQQILRDWPWQFRHTNYGFRFPPGISIRLRMELKEILKYDDLIGIIRKLDEWKVLALFNEKIIVNNKFIRGLRWLKRLNGNIVLFLIKDSTSLEIASDRFFINQKEKKHLRDFLKVKKFLQNNKDELHKFCPSNWTNFIEERNLDPESVKLIICEGGIFWRPFFKWLMVYRHIKSKKNGETLKKEGFKFGREIGEELKRLRYEEIDEYKKN